MSDDIWQTTAMQYSGCLNSMNARKLFPCVICRRYILTPSVPNFCKVGGYVPLAPMVALPMLRKQLKPVSYAIITELSQVKPGFHYPNWRPELTARVDGWPVSITRQHGACWWAHVSTSRVDGWPRPVNSGSGNWKQGLRHWGRQTGYSSTLRFCCQAEWPVCKHQWLQNTVPAPSTRCLFTNKQYKNL